MPRYRLDLEYDGTPFVGWQRQDNGLSVQGALEAALARFTREVPTVTGAGRTDAGVHATGQVAHVDLAREWDPFRLSEALNYHLRPDPVAVVTASVAPEGFHSRFSAKGRAYRYRIDTRRAPKVLEPNRSWRIAQTLDLPAMQVAAGYLAGHHDFSAFRSAYCQAQSALRTLDRLAVIERGDEIHIEAEARSFLHNQVRIMVGSLAQVGFGRWAPERIKTALESGLRVEAGQTAPPQGLYLTAVTY
jgi:tRNA pseudouridine38-40 synthase